MISSACEKGCKEDVERPQDPNIANDSGWTALHAAAKSGSPDVVALLEARASPNRTTQDTCATPLLLAVADDHEEVVRLLLGAGASPDLTLAKTGTAPLHFAAENGQLELVRWEAGARYASRRHWYNSVAFRS